MGKYQRTANCPANTLTAQGIQTIPTNTGRNMKSQSTLRAMIVGGGLLFSAAVLLLTLVAAPQASPGGERSAAIRGQARLPVIQEPETVVRRSEVQDSAAPACDRFVVVVCDETGAPRSGVTISRVDNARYAVHDTDRLAITNATGSAVVNIAQVASCNAVIVSTFGYLPARVNAPVGGSVYRVTLDPGLTLSIRVVDTAGKALENVQVGYSSSRLGGFQVEPDSIAPCYSNAGPRVLAGKSDSDGRIAFSGIRPGHCTLWSIDPRYPFATETQRRASTLSASEDLGLVTLVVDFPLIAFWSYTSDKVVDYGSMAIFKGSRNQKLEMELTETIPNSFAFVVNGHENVDVKPLSVEALLSRGAIVTHEVPFVALSVHPMPIQVGSSVTANGAMGRVLIVLDGQWCNPDRLMLNCVRLPQEGQSRLLKRISVGGGGVILPVGWYDIVSDTGMIESSEHFQVIDSRSESVVRVKCRQDVAIASITVVGRTGREISASGVLFGSSGLRFRRGLGLSSKSPIHVALGVGGYRLTAVTSYEHTMDQSFSISENDVRREIPIVVTVDDA